MDDANLVDEMVLLRAQLQLSRNSELRWRLFVLAVILLGAFLLVGQHQATEGIVATRTESRMSTCLSDNTFIANHNRLVDSVEQAAQLVNAPNPQRTPDQQSAVDRFVSDYIATVEQSRVPLRDCSPEAIDAFYKRG